jgi:hypothetical protein
MESLPTPFSRQAKGLLRREGAIQPPLKFVNMIINNLIDGTPAVLGKTAARPSCNHLRACSSPDSSRRQVFLRKRFDRITLLVRHAARALISIAV